MPNQDDEQEKSQDDEVVEAPDVSEEASTDEPEETSNDEQVTAEPDVAPEGSDESSDSEPSGGLGDQEAVMSDNEPPKQPGKFKRFFAGYWHHKKWTLPLTLLVIIGITFAVPASRYPLLALKMQRSFSVEVMDSKTNAPVSGAAVTLDGKTAMTDSAGKAKLTAKVGKRTVDVSKKYYKSFSENVFVGIGSAHNSSKVELQATGRQIFIKVMNKITGKPVANAEVKVLDTDAKTDSNGLASIVLPNISSTQTAMVSANGYNTTTGKLQVVNLYLTDAGRTINGTPYVNYDLTPSGRVYFLSNLSGNIDVVSTNLDGTDRKTVLAGTGNEDQNNTVLLASRDWKYLALLSKRDGGQYAKLFLINTSDNQVTTMDEGNATFTPVGWSRHIFVYQVSRANVKDWQPGQYVIKSYAADTGKLTMLDQTTASGTSENNYVGQNFGYDYASNVYIAGSQIIYVKQWAEGYAGPGGALNGKQEQILSVNADGSNRQVLKSIAAPTTYGFGNFQSLAYKPNEVYFQFSNGPSNTYYEYANGFVTQTNTMTDGIFQQYEQNYTTYLLSPSGSQTFWAEQRDGKNTLFVGDASGGNSKQIATLSDYTSYGWYGDSYVLVEKSGSELYIMPAGGGKALKISDYYKPVRNFNGYGGGYGGL